MGIVTTSSTTAFLQPAETIYDFVTNPANWTKTYPGSAHVGQVPTHLPLNIGDVWTEAGPDGNRIYTWHLAIAMRPRMWVFNSVGRLGHDRDGNGGMDDGCKASCVDWYGNARPIFLRNRVFALLGYEIVEGRLERGAISEVRRTSFSPR